MEKICDNCRHYRRIEMTNAETGLREESGYCKASRNYATKKPDDTCARYHFSESKVFSL